jgi:probable F420-dependent oxidoreductase
VKVGITSFCLDRTIHPVKLAREAEARGFESLWYPEHSHIPTSRMTPWPGGPNGEPLPDDYWRMHDMFNALSMAAAVTTTLKIGTGVALIGQRDPIWTAKQISSLDHLSGGRLMIGIGFGWNREEQENHGYPWADRRAMIREKVEAMRELWTKDEASYEGRHVQFAPAWQLPKPVQQPYPPVYIGGGWGPVLFDHICQWADGWMPVSARGSLASRLALLDEACERNGRDRATVAVSVFGATTDPAGVENLATEGIDRIILTLPYEADDVVMPLLDEWAPLVEVAANAS